MSHFLLHPFCFISFRNNLRQYLTDDLRASSSSWTLRPWQLPHRADFGLRGTADAVRSSIKKHVADCVADPLSFGLGSAQPSAARASERVPIGPKHAASGKVDYDDMSNFLEPPLLRVVEDLGLEESQRSLLRPQVAFAVKGWNRSLALLGICYCGFTTPALIEAS